MIFKKIQFNAILYIVYPSKSEKIVSFNLFYRKFVCSGKSNLMDAISFVLGEKTSNLRSKRLPVTLFYSLSAVATPLYVLFLILHVFI